MTKVEVAQEVPLHGADVVDLLVPPPRTAAGMALWLLATLSLLAGAVVLALSGLVSTKLSARAVSWSAGERGHGAYISFVVENSAWTGVTITSVGEDLPGLGQVRYRFSSPPLASLATPSWTGSARLTGHGGVEVTLSYRALECRVLRADHELTIPIRVHTALGLSSTVNLEPVRFVPAGGAFVPTPVAAVEAHQIGWPQAISWAACHPRSPSPVPLISP